MKQNPLNNYILYESLNNIYEVYIYKKDDKYYISGNYKGHKLPLTIALSYGKAYIIFNKRLVYIKNLMFNKYKKEKRFTYV